jgi:hypothetical protein
MNGKRMGPHRRVPFLPGGKICRLSPKEVRRDCLMRTRPILKGSFLAVFGRQIGVSEPL